MKRRDFFTKLGIGLASAAVATKVSTEVQTQTPPQATLRPKCRKCSIPMLVRYDSGTYAFCGNTNCKRYGKQIRLKPVEE
jgi:hypothetical protein